MIARQLAALTLLVAGLSGTTASPASADPGPQPGTPAPGVPGVEVRELAFTVRNVNRTALPCPGGDGSTRTLAGRIIAPAGTLARGAVPRVNLLVHDISTGGWFWSMPGHPRVDHAAQLARLGEVSVVIDRLGYDGSPLEHGDRTCLGAQADMVHQVLTQLRAGGYGGPAASEVVLHGHSVGAAIAELAAATWRDADGLVVMGWTDSGATPRAITEAATQNAVCLLGGDRSVPQRGYAHYGQTAESWRSMLFVTAAPEVQASALPLRNPDPCGDATSLAHTVVGLNVLTHLIDVPVLLLHGERDALNRPDARALQRLAYGPSARVEAHVLPGTGSSLPLEATAPTTRALTRDWLCRTLGC